MKISVRGLLGLGLLGLSACAPRAESAFSPSWQLSVTPISATSNAPMAGAPAARPGRWRLVAGSDFDPANPVTLCLSGQRLNWGSLAATCPQSRVRSIEGGAALDGVCQLRGATVKIHGTATGDLQSDYETDLAVDITPAPGAPAQTIRAHDEYQYVGGCAPGERADDE
jgi:hypothetical protein